MAKARVLIIKDAPQMRDWVRRYLVQSGHDVVGEASTFDEATACVDRLDELNPDIVVLDANLTKGARGGGEGQQLSYMIRQRRPATKIISWSDGPCRYGDRNISKPWSISTLDDKGELETAIQELLRHS